MTLRQYFYAVFILFLFALFPNKGVTQDQDYLTAIGDPSWSVTVPVENGFIDVSNGNIHMEFSLATFKQRGALQLNERLVYDSKIWMIGCYSHCYWWPNNVPNAPGGWRFVSGGEVGTLIATPYMSNVQQCNVDIYGDASQYTEIDTFSWIDPSGTSHSFPPISTDMPCSNGSGNPPVGAEPESDAFAATDASGFTLQVVHETGIGTTSAVVTDSSRTERTPQIIDRFGNYWSTDSNGNLVDDLGRTPVVSSANSDGSVVYYDVLIPAASNSSAVRRARYTVTYTSVHVSTGFNSPNIVQWQGSIPVVHSIQLPDGSSYVFGYDDGGYGEMTSVTLPTGGVITYGYQNFIDAYGESNRWLSSRTLNGTDITRFTPQTLGTCSGLTGCQEQVTVTKPSNDDTVYGLILNNGAWNTSAQYYSGLSTASPNHLLLSTATTYDFTHTCTGCNGSAAYITAQKQTVTVPAIQKTSVTRFSYNDPATGQLSARREWDYGDGSASGLPARETDYIYGDGYDVTQEIILDASGSKAAETDYAYTTDALATSGVVAHGASNAGGPYLQSISKWLNTSPLTPSVTTYSNDDTGAILSVTDADGNPPTTLGYDPTHTFITSITRPMLSGISHVSKAVYDPSTGSIVQSDDENSVSLGNTLSVTYSYEGVAGRLWTINTPDGGLTTYTYPSHNEIDAAILATPDPTIITSTVVDVYGRSYKSVKGEMSQEASYDSNGRVHSVTNPHPSIASASSSVMTSYDALDRVIAHQYTGAASGYIDSFCYNGVSNAIHSSCIANQSSVIGTWINRFSGTGTPHQQVYDALGRLRTVLEPDITSEPTVASTYSYDGLGNVIGIQQHGAAGIIQSRSFTYDSVSQLICSSNPEVHLATCTPGAITGYISGTVGYAYDLNGNLKSKTAPQNNAPAGSSQTSTLSYTYDALNRITQTAYSDGSPFACAQYDQSAFAGTGANLVGRLASEWTARVACSTLPTSTSARTRRSILAYDSVGKVVAEQQCVFSSCTPGSSPSWLAYSYDYAGKMIANTNGAGNISFGSSYDSSGRLLSVSNVNPWNNPTQYPTMLMSAPSYNAAGITSANIGNHLLVQWTYDPKMRVVGESVGTQ